MRTATESERGAVSGAAGENPGEGIPAVPDHRQHGDGTITAAIAFPGNTASTFLTHFFGSGLTDEPYVVERLRALACGNIRRVAGEQPATTTKGKRRAKRAAATLNEVKELRHARTEIIICTGLRTRGGQQLWGDIATSMFHDRRQKR